MKIIDEIKAAAIATAGIKSFGHGVRAYANLEQENESLAEFGEDSFPRVWMYPFSSEDEFAANGNLIRTYKVTVDIAGLHQQDDSSDIITEHLKLKYGTVTEFLTRLYNSSNVSFVTGIQRAPFQSQYDENLIGYACTFRVKLINDDLIPCI